MVQQISALIPRIRDEQGISILFIEQNVELALRLADRGYILESGRTILTGPRRRCSSPPRSSASSSVTSRSNGPRTL